jgi:LPS sulfotransferase NodH
MNDKPRDRKVHPLPRVAARLARAGTPHVTGEHLTPADDYMGSADVTDTIVILAAPRTGSNLLTYSLQSIGFGAGREFWSEPAYWHAYVRWGFPRPQPRGVLGQTRRALERQPRWWWHTRLGADEFVRYHRVVEQHRTGPNGVFVVKLFGPHIHMLERRTGLLPTDVLRGNLHWVVLRRQDKIAQAVSIFRAERNDAWLDKDGMSTPPLDPDDVGPDDLSRIVERATELLEQETDLFAICDRFGVDPFIIDHERLRDDVAGVLRELVEPFGGEVPDDFVAPTHRQSDAVNEAIRERVLAAFPSVAAHSRLLG